MTFGFAIGGIPPIFIDLARRWQDGGLCTEEMKKAAYSMAEYGGLWKRYVLFIVSSPGRLPPSKTIRLHRQDRVLLQANCSAGG